METEFPARKYTALLAQEVACWQRPIYSAAWAASVHLVWYYLSFSQRNFITTCCTLGFVAIAVDYAVSFFQDRLRHLPLLPETINRENGLQSANKISFLDSPRTYHELVQQSEELLLASRNVHATIVEWKHRHNDYFCGGLAVGIFFLGVVLNRVPGPLISYSIVLFILLLPVLERSRQLRDCCSHFNPTQLSHYFGPDTQPHAPHHEEVAHLAAHLPECVLEPVVPALIPDPIPDDVHDAHEIETKEALKSFLEEEAQEEAARELKAQRRLSARLSADSLGSVPSLSSQKSSSASLGAEPADALSGTHVSAEGLRKRVARNVETDDDFDLIQMSEADN